MLRVEIDPRDLLSEFDGGFDVGEMVLGMENCCLRGVLNCEAVHFLVAWFPKVETECSSLP